MMRVRYWVAAASAVLAGVSAWADGRTCTMTATADAAAGTFVATFANHAHETNGLWAVYGALDCGEGTSGWEHAVFVQTVLPETETVSFAQPEGWGDSVKAFRFVLSEVPYEVDYTLAYLQNNMTNRICLTDFDFKGNYRLVTQMKRVSYSTGNPAFFCTRHGCANSSDPPYFTLFQMSPGTTWRFDYNTTTGSKTSTVTLANGKDYLIDASWKGLVVNGTAMNSLNTSATYFTGSTAGKLEFFCGNTKATSMANAGHVLQLSWARIYDYFDAEGNVKESPTLVVDLVPAVKGGIVGAYDVVRKVFYTSDTGTAFEEAEGTRVESENPVFASALFKIKTAGPEIFGTATFKEDATSYTNSYGGILVGEGALKLTGANDWGGAFIVSNGTLIAEVGQGLGTNDRIVLSDAGSYGGWNGVVTNSIGTGAGQISPEGVNPYLSFTAAEGELHVNLGGAGAAWEPTMELRRLRLNMTPVDGVVYFDNPIHMNTATNFILRNYRGESVLTKPYIESADNQLKGNVFSVYGETGSTPGGNTTTVASTNAFGSLTLWNGGWTFGENSTNAINGQINVMDGAFLATNAVVVQTGVSTLASPEMYVKGGTATFVGGSFTTGTLVIGQDSGTQGGAVVVDGDVTVKVIANGVKQVYGTPVIRYTAASAALTLNEHANMVVQNFRFRQRNIYQNGGLLKLLGNTGIIDMGQGGTTRYVLRGGRVETPCFLQDKDHPNNTAQVVILGGTLAVTQSGAIFRQFGAASGVFINGNKGGTIESDAAVSVSVPMGRDTVSVGGDSWNYSASEYLTAPALRKTGTGTLTLTTNTTYLCATEVAAGTLTLSGANALLPTGGVVRVTGGTLDLGGNVQKLRALCGTSGRVTNGSVAVTDGVYPGGAGTVGAFTNDVALTGTLYADVAADGAADQLVTTAALDLSKIDLVVSAPETAPQVTAKLAIISGPYTGAFKSVTGLPSGWAIAYRSGSVAVGPAKGIILLFR